jgi:hypothetical protein
MNGQLPINAQSLTTPTVARFFLVHLTGFEHTSSSAHELRLCLSLLFLCVTLTLLSLLTFINSVLPTKHLFDHHRP